MSFPAAALLESAHKYRLHQDVLRWTLLAGYAAFFTASMSLLTSASFSKNVDGYIATCIALFVIGNLYLLMLAVENWFYNVFAKHVAECEKRMQADEQPRTVGEFTRAEGSSITPFHPSFIFAFLFVSVGNSIYLHFVMGAFYLHPIIDSSMDKWLISLLWFIVYFSAFTYLFRNWNRLMYKGVIERLQNLFIQ